MELGEGVLVVEQCHDDTNGKNAVDALCGNFGRRHMDIQNILAWLEELHQTRSIAIALGTLHSGAVGSSCGES